MKKILVGVLTATLLACSTSKVAPNDVIAENGSEGVEVIDEIIEQEIPAQRAVYRESETILTDLIHTKLEVNFDWEKSRMNGIATITAKPHFYTTNTLILDAKGMIINSIKKEGESLTYTYDSSYLEINLGKDYTRKDEYTVVIDYVSCPEERKTGGSAAILSDKGLYFINPTGEDENKMPQIWTQGETEASSVWFPTIDSPNAKTSQEIYITVDDKFKTLSNGKLMSSKKIGDNKRVDHWKQELKHSPYLFMMGIGEFKVVEDAYTRADGTKMEVNYYVEPEWEPYAKDIFGETPNMIKFFSERLGVEYPWDKYHQIVTRDYVSGAMENTGAVIFGDFVYKNKRELLDGNDQSTIAHELFHHWFGDLVTCESWSNLTLNESFANYSQYLWDEYRFGVDEADYQAEGEADGYYQSAQMQGYHNLVWFDYDDKEQMFDGHSYNKGGRILHMLRNYLGDDAFFEALKRYLTRYQFKAAEFHHLRLVFEEVSGEDLNWFFNQWYLGSGHPILKFEHDFDAEKEEVTITVEQKQNLEDTPIFKLPIQFAVYDENGKNTYKAVIDQVKQSFTFSCKGGVKGIMFDDQHMLLAKTNEDKTTDQYIFQFYNDKRYDSKKEGLMKGSRDKGEAGQKLILDALGDSFWHIRSLAIGKVHKLRDENKLKGVEILKELLVNDPNSSVRASALNAISKVLDDEELSVIYKNRISEDQSYSVVTSALRNLGKSNPEEAIKLAESLESERSSKMISGIAQLYAGHAGKEKFEFFQNSLSENVVQGFDKLGLLNSLTMFIAQHDAELIEKAYPLYEDLSENGGFYVKMFLPQNIGYLSGQFNAKINQLEDEIKKHETNNDAVYADQARKEVKKYEALKLKFEAMAEELQKESGKYKVMVSGDSEED